MSELDGQDVFNEEDTDVTEDTVDDGAEDSQDAEAGAVKTDEEDAGDEGEGSADKGDKDSEETPSTDEDGKPSQAEKMIPESRLKAAVKDVTEERDRLRVENEQLKAKPAPDKEKDPEGYDLHMRIEESKAMCMEVYPDYAEKAKYFNDVMLKADPNLANIVAGQRMPAKFAYDIAKRAMEIEEVTEVRKSDDWKQFKEWQKTKGKTDIGKQLTDAKPETKAQPAAAKVPNLNRNPSVTPGKKGSSEEDDGLFSDSKIDGSF